MSRPDGMVDPTSESDVARVLDAVLRTMGTGGLVDLLGRLPGVRVEPGSPKRFLSAAVPPSIWIGDEDSWVIGDSPGAPVEHRQTVSGVVLHRQTIPPGRLGPVLAAQLLRLTQDQASYDEARRGAVGGLGRRDRMTAYRLVSRGWTSVSHHEIGIWGFDVQPLRLIDMVSAVTHTYLVVRRHVDLGRFRSMICPAR